MAYIDENGVLRSNILYLPNTFEYSATLATSTPPTEEYTNQDEGQYFTCNPETGLLELASEKSLTEYLYGGAYEYMMGDLTNEEGFIDDCPYSEEDEEGELTAWL